MQELTLYIHDRQNVIRPLTITITHDAPMDEDSNRDLTNIARKIAEEIERGFPKSQAQGVINDIIPIIRYAYLPAKPSLRGVALKVYGVLEDHDARARGNTISMDEVHLKFEQIQQQCEKSLQDAQHKITLLEADLAETRRQSMRMQRLYSRQQRAGHDHTISELTTQRNELLQVKEEHEHKISELTAQRDMLLQVKGNLEMQLQQTGNKSRLLNDAFEELRQQNTTLEQDRKELERQIKQEPLPTSVIGTSTPKQQPKPKRIKQPVD